MFFLIALISSSPRTSCHYFSFLSFAFFLGPPRSKQQANNQSNKANEEREEDDDDGNGNDVFFTRGRY
jgi:hypothetical protein